MSIAPVTHRLLPVLVGTLLLVACKKEEPAAPPLQVRPTFMQLNQPAKSDPASIPLKRTDGSDVTLGQVATGKVVVVVPWISLQKNADQRIRDVRDAVKGMQGVQVLALNAQPRPKEDFLSDLAKQEAELGVPVYVDSELKLLPFINEHLKVRARDAQNRRAVTVPPYVLLTNNLRHIAIDIPSPDLKADVSRVVNQALMAAARRSNAPERGDDDPSAASDADGDAPAAEEPDPTAQEPAAP